MQHQTQTRADSANVKNDAQKDVKHELEKKGSAWQEHAFNDDLVPRLNAGSTRMSTGIGAHTRIIQTNSDLMNAHRPGTWSSHQTAGNQAQKYSEDNYHQGYISLDQLSHKLATGGEHQVKPNDESSRGSSQGANQREITYVTIGDIFTGSNALY
jgi:hypothetical protein